MLQYLPLLVLGPLNEKYFFIVNLLIISIDAKQKLLSLQLTLINNPLTYASSRLYLACKSWKEAYANYAHTTYTWITRDSFEIFLGIQLRTSLN